MKTLCSLMGGIMAAILLAACARDVNSPQGFRLPEGDVDAGRLAFQSVGCVQCHTVKGDSFAEAPMPQAINVVLGGEVSRVKNYAQLVTSIIYPSHSISGKPAADNRDAQGNSLMPDLTSQMTVRQMIDITQYLQGHYTVVTPKYPEHGVYFY